MVQVDYDASSDVLSIILAAKRVKESAEILPDVIVDFDDDGRGGAFEILDAGKVIDMGRTIPSREKIFDACFRFILQTKGRGCQVR